MRGILQSDLFQDDLFPETKVTWEPTMTSAEWLSGCNRPQKRISLKPPDMDCCKFLCWYLINLPPVYIAFYIKN